MEFISQDIVVQIINSIVPGACFLGVSFALCEVVFQFFMRMSFPKQFIKD